MKKIVLIVLILLTSSVFCFAEEPGFVKEQSYLLNGFMEVKDRLSHQGSYVDGVYLSKKNNKPYNGKETYEFNMMVNNPENDKREKVYTQIECKFKNGKINGIVKIYKKLGKKETVYLNDMVVHTVFEMKDGVIISDITNYKEVGPRPGEREAFLIGRFSYKNGKIDGTVNKYDYKSGAVVAQIKYENGVPTGDCNEFFSNGKLETSVKYVNGKREGAFVRYHSNGQLCISMTYKNDKAEGKRTEYYDNGNVCSVRIYKNGKIEGNDIGYYKNKNLEYSENYKNGYRNGKQRYWYSNGNIEEEFTYINGVLNGPFLKNYENGILAKKGTYKNGKLHGAYQENTPKGQLFRKSTYENGAEVSVQYEM
ncbi:antitoxin component YwqK of YwqJK toxin-antitoxin module [Fusobacterium sp. PH5-7]|uniref:toxin-antitoxin system YwqK family antitoxin n=1 Tax=Fusobacterium sp. PH5-7 TaxID=2940528 RepID=UPI002476A94F|nr:toxin-antitoxin system YwqK family antitoxin [Fusobacterium sp. PH5-7]MDH6458246.1 antitoxin component YwqK of YwqJK toxin-antitoxin module [Fusobacterium sp. PH5-7]